MRVVRAKDIEDELGPFSSLEEIGPPSGSGECWKGECGSDLVVVKVIVKEHEPGRFQRELEALKRIKSDRVMHVHSDGTLTTEAGDSFPYLISEFVPGVHAAGEVLTRKRW